MIEDDRPALTPAPRVETGELVVRPAPVDRLSDAAVLEREFAAIVENSILPASDETAKVAAPQRWIVQPSTATFADVCGHDTVKRTLRRQVVSATRPTPGVLLYGPVGCGKAMLARALAGEIGAGFVQILARDLVRPDLPVRDDDITDLFAMLRTSGPVVLLLDGIEALSAPDAIGGHDLIDQLAIELGRLRSAAPGTAGADVVVVASSDQPWAIDARLRGAGQFRRALFVAPPSAKIRRELFRRSLPGRTSPALSLRRLARCTGGVSAADIAAICAHAGEEAALDAIEGDHHLITMADFAWWNSQTPRTAGEWSRRSLAARRAA